MQHQATNTFDEGIYDYSQTKKFYFGKNELSVGNIDYLLAEVEGYVKWTSQVIKPKIVSKFNIKTRGRIITIEPIKLSNGDILDFSAVDID